MELNRGSKINIKASEKGPIFNVWSISYMMPATQFLIELIWQCIWSRLLIIYPEKCDNQSEHSRDAIEKNTSGHSIKVGSLEVYRAV